jgi:hypothetical protein
MLLIQLLQHIVAWLYLVRMNAIKVCALASSSVGPCDPRILTIELATPWYTERYNI